LHRRVDGPDGAPVVVLGNALGTTLAMWDAQASVLAERFRVVRYDMRGHGRSPVLPGPYSVDGLGRDVLALLDELECKRVSYCGLSLGGAVGMWLALEAPERLDRIALCCTKAAFPPPEQWVERAAVVRESGVCAVAEGALGRWFTPRFHAEHAEVVDGFRRMLVHTPADGYAGCCDALATFDVRLRLGSIVARTLIVTGADDPTAPPDSGAEIAAAIPGSTHVVLEHAGHMANVEQADAFTEALLTHLKT
jgi:3-oxoadipate enol-lactonase